MEQELKLLNEILLTKKQELLTIDRKHDEESRKHYNELYRQVELIINVINYIKSSYVE